MKKRVIIIIICVLVIGIGGYAIFNIISNSNNNTVNNNENNKDNIVPSDKEKKDDETSIDDDNKYINIGLNNKKLLKKDLKVTDNAKVNSSKIINKLNIAFLDVIEPDFQFETHYLFCFDQNGKLIFEVRNYKDEDNDNNRYKYNGKFDFDETSKVLSLYTNIFLGESDESSGTAFDDKEISELTKEEKNKLGNYSDLVKYEFKYVNNKFQLSKKTEISKLKANDYYKNILK